MSLIEPWYLKLGRWALAHWRWIVYPGVIIFVFLFGYCKINSCRQQNQKDKEQELRDDENRQKGQLDILKEIEANANIQIQQAGQNSNMAGNNLNAVINTDSNKFNSNFRAVRKRFCDAHPDDSQCRP